MARKSRKIKANEIMQDNTRNNTEKIYKTAIYARLSVEDSDTHKTIENQILLVQKYIEGKQDLDLCGIFTDNGQTGTNFNRNGFQNLMEAIKYGKIDCIVVKDLSRLGRDYIETGNYLENIFPFFGVRFISVNDDYDSRSPANSNSNNLTVILKNLINDIYAKDISKKVKTALEIKQKKGEFIGNTAPYGYIKSQSERGKLLINEETAPIVRRIFQNRFDGMTIAAIIRKLNVDGVQSPSNYLYSKSLLSSEKYSKKILWNTNCIKKMLANPVYIGHMPQRKSKGGLNMGSKRKLQPIEKWIIVENTHEPLIDAEIFRKININFII